MFMSPYVTELSHGELLNVVCETSVFFKVISKAAMTYDTILTNISTNHLREWCLLTISCDSLFS